MPLEMGPEFQRRVEQVAKLPKPVRLGIFGGLCALVAVGYFFFVYRDTNAELDRLHAKDLELQRKLSEVRSVAANLAEFEAEITDLEAQLSQALRQLPNEKQLEVLLTDISNLGKTAGVEIRSFKRENEIVHDFYAEVPISIELKGRFHDIARFFDLVSKLPRIVNMGAMSIKIQSESESETVLSVSGTATTFRFVGGA